MIRKLKSGQYRLYSRKVDPATGKRRNLGTFETREAADKHGRGVQYFKRHCRHLTNDAKSRYGPAECIGIKKEVIAGNAGKAHV